MVLTYQQEISLALHGSAAETFWTGTSYLLTSAVFQPVIAASSRWFGSKQLLIMSVLLFLFGTAFCAIAHDIAVMLVGRCIQGTGGGGIITMTQVIFSDMVPLKQRPKYFSMVLGSWSIGSIIGPVMGGSLVEHASWRWCFYIQFPFCILGLGAALLFVREDNSRSSSSMHRLPFVQKIRQMDWVGAILFVGGVTGLLIGISWGGTQHPWKSVATVAPIVMGVLSLVSFAVWQVYVTPNSLLPISLFCSRSLAAAFYCASMNGLVVSLFQ